MRKVGSIAVLVALALPHDVQQAIVKKFPRFAYVPTRLPDGNRYSSYSFDQSGFRVLFRRAGHSHAELQYSGDDLRLRKSYTSVPPVCSRLPGPTKTFTANGVEVAWTVDAGGDYAWRCFDNHIDITAGAATRADQVSTGAMVQILAHLERLS
ncbi:MAG TPA: hypothetical protein VJ814_09320 [Gaiellaceae bacterium]|nr:hypothetical protein [Gaiellaceae bacterium]